MVRPTTPNNTAHARLSKYIAQPTHFQVGGTGSLFIAKNRETNELVAIKVITFKDKTYRKAYETETKILTEMKYSFYITKMKEHFIYNNCGYIVMELLQQDLYTRSERFETIAEVKHIFQQICLGVSELHQQHVAHLDIKPENILLDNNDNVKICDFGSSFLWKQSRQHYGFVGSDYYLAPEIFAHKQGYDAPRADIWSLGIMLFVMLTDTYPFAGEGRDETLANYFMHRVTLTELEHVCPGDIACHTLISKMLCNNPMMRPSIDEILRDEWFLTNEDDVSPMM